MSRLSQWLRASPLRRPLSVGLLALTLFAAIQANWQHPALRFESTLLNHLFLLLAFILPWVAAGAFFFLPRLWGRVLALLVLAPVLVYSALFALLTADLTAHTVRQGYDIQFQPLSTVPMGNYRVRIFRTDCGVWCEFGIAVRQERRLVPGVLLVRQIDHFEAYDASYVVVGPDSLRINDRLYVLDSAF
jgi:hypothetical protein